jgi:hypothetical protein
MIISAATHPHYRVRDDRGDEVRDVIRIDTEAMTILTLVRDRAGAALRDGCGIVTQERRILDYRFEPGDVLRVQIGGAT